MTLQRGSGSPFVLKSSALDRWAVHRRGTRAERILFHHLGQVIKSDTLKKRRDLGRQYIQEHEESLASGGVTIERRSGYGSIFWGDSEPFQAASAEAKRFLDLCPQDADLPSKGTIDYIVSAEDTLNYADFRIGHESALAKLAVHPEILVPITKYFDMLPILAAATVCRSPNATLIDQSSQMFHLDPEDLTQIKLFIYLNDVDDETGPFTAVSSDLSARMIAELDYGIGRLTDEQVAKVVGPHKARPFLGPAGTGIFCDTNRCFHFGSRPGKRPRDMLFFMYILPTSTWFPLFPGDGEPKTMVSRFLHDQMSPLERILLGLDLTV